MEQPLQEWRSFLGGADLSPVTLTGSLDNYLNFRKLSLRWPKWGEIHLTLGVILGIQITQWSSFLCSWWPIKSWQATYISRTTGHLGWYKLCIHVCICIFQTKILMLDLWFWPSGVDSAECLLFCYWKSVGGFPHCSIAPEAVAVGIEAATSSVRLRVQRRLFRKCWVPLSRGLAPCVPCVSLFGNLCYRSGRSHLCIRTVHSHCQSLGRGEKSGIMYVQISLSHCKT